MEPDKIEAKYGGGGMCPICEQEFSDGPNAEYIVKYHHNSDGDWVAVSYHYRCYELDPMRQFRVIMDEVG